MSSAILTVNEVNATSEISDSLSTSHHPPNKRRRLNNNGRTSSKFKGVMRQKNGQWGAQLYANHTRIWLGTFKSEAAAAMAYDSAAIMYRSGENHRNFPRTESTVVEPKFQNHHGADAVLRMIRDGSYQSKLIDFFKACSTSEKVEINLNPVGTYDKAGLYYKQLFQKELTPSDVGKLNRLVIPKKYAIKYFPRVRQGENENIEGDGSKNSNDSELVFYDKFMRLWKFRYCYWSSSQSYVFTRGWNRFLKEKQLEANDLVSFYVCECKRENQIWKFCMIDVNKQNVGNEEAFAQAANMQVGREAGLHCDAFYGEKGLIEAWPKGEGKEKQVLIAAAGCKTVVNTKGVKLFGVNIN